jgi:alpha-beta hydrolase superfamily lysophospholipase
LDLREMWMRETLVLMGVMLLMVACTPLEQPARVRDKTPMMSASHLHMGDGAELPYRQWQVRKPRAVILALHGFNDYSKSFTRFAGEMNKHRVAVIAYDQRGFGKNEQAGIWGGTENLTQDACDALALLREKYTHIPIFLLGDSMGASVAIRAYNQCGTENIESLILVAPAVWGEETMNPLYRAVLWLTAHTLPAKKLTGEGLRIKATDNVEALEEMSRDPYVIKATRVDAIYGLLDLMDAAHADLHHVDDVRVLILYGQHDQVVPRQSVDDLERHLSDVERIDYEHGYHMLLRDLQRQKVYGDVVNWVRRAQK